MRLSVAAFFAARALLTIGIGIGYKDKPWLMVAYATVALLQLIIAVGSYRGWRPIFYVALVFLLLGAISAFTQLTYFANPGTSPVPTWALVVGEVTAVGAIGLSTWLLIASFRFRQRL